ncbi:syntaxin-binding protein 5 isoform X2 [Parasteatoda tepidariorum]|uniref:syntaxin-binding protein 5 isoform X2 n=1 Tax=Parasteatoda tepidariorum TaxID=114398 RepID=UPI00077F9B80|nr:syntaxin-binding protein 5 isoform X2 [Parasteatoda tepidariorum]
MPRPDIKRSSGFFKGVLDGLRSSVSQRSEYFPDENLQPELFRILKTVRHGFPFQPTAIAFDAVQHILAIGTKNGSLRLFGRPGVDACVQHDIDSAIIQILFLVNEGALVTVCADDSVHLWNIRQKQPEIVQTIRFQKERITYACLPFHSRWLYVGTERGNVHIVNVESFVLSGYVINWNRAVEISRKSHPGVVIHLSDNPVDPNKLLIGYESGTVVLWDLKNKAADCRFQSNESLKSASWHHEGRQFMCSYSDGSIKTWNIKNSSKPESVMFPHAKSVKEGNPESCQQISKVEWKTARGSDSFIAFSGGMPLDQGNLNPCVTVIHGKTTTVLEMEHSIIDFVMLCETPWPSDYQDPYAIVVLLYNDLVVIDLTSSGYPCYQNPYPMDLHESPVTSCTYLADCPNDLIPALYSTGSKGKKNQSFSEKEWPIDGGGWGMSTQSYPEVIITGHADGSLKFWDASSVSLQILYKLKISRIFEKPKLSSDGGDDDPFAIEHVAFCSESRTLCVADASSHVIVFQFQQQESQTEITVLEIPVFYETDEDPDNPEGDASSSQNVTPQAEAAKTTCGYYPTKVKASNSKRNPGFQADLVCLAPVINRDSPQHITALTVNTTIGLMSYGSEYGLTIVDLVQKCCVACMTTADLYGSSDPYQRVPRSPKRTMVMLGDNPSEQDKCRSPTADQVNGMCLSPTTRKHLLQRKPASAEMRRTKSQDKIDNSFSRSRSSSMSSLENMNSESVQCLIFAESYCRKSDFVTAPTLWVGTNLGSVLVILLTLSPEEDQRYTQPVIVSPSGTVYRLKGSILSITFLDSTGMALSLQFESWKMDTKSNTDKEKKKLSLNNQSKSKVSPTSSSDSSDAQLVLLCSEKQAFVVTVPSQSCVQKINLAETSFVVKAEVIFLKEHDKICLGCYSASGNLTIYSLPSLKIVCNDEFLPLADMRIARTFCFSKNGHGVYLCSPTELQKFSISSSYCNNLQDMLGTLFINKEIPEAPKLSFFKGLFTTAPSVIDREELFGASSGKPSKNVASSVHISSNTEQIKGQSGSLGYELAKVKQNLAERGENLSQLEERTEKMMSEAESFQSAARQLATKFKDKKWYQF